MQKYFFLFIKGIAMGIANVIPGVSGGTIALITNIYEDLIKSLKSFNLRAVKLIFSGKIREFIKYTNFYFLVCVLGGSIVSLFSIAKLFEYLLVEYPDPVWSFFFGLILASVYYVGLRINKWKTNTISLFIIGSAIAISISFLSEASPNNNLFYVFLCGAIGITGMILPGLSGSFILILMGNYKLLMVDAVSKSLELNIEYLTLLLMFLVGSIAGLVGFSNIIAWLFKRFKDQVLALLTGFILGSLLIIWPWKIKAENGLIESWYLPTNLNTLTILSISFIFIGIFSVILLEYYSKETSK